MNLKRTICGLTACLLAQSCLLSLHAPSGPTAKNVITFEGVDASHDRVVADKYLWEKYRIRISDVTPGTRVFIVSDKNLYDGGVLQASSGHNVLTQGDSADPVSFTLKFSKPLTSVQFTRPKLIAGVNGITFPEWTAIPLDHKGKAVGEPVGEPLGKGKDYYHDVPAKIFTVSGPHLRAIRFESNNYHFAAFGAVIIDDLTLIEGKGQ